MILYLQYFVDAVSVGSLYALAALGIGLIFGVMRFVNLAHGDFITLGAYALIVPSANPVASMLIGNLPWPLLVLADSAVVMLFAVATAFLVFRPLRNAEPATIMVASFAVSFVIQNILLLVFESRPKSVNLWTSLNIAWNVGGVRVPPLQIVAIAVTFVLLAAIALFLRKSQYGIRMRAAAEDFKMARLLGVRADSVTITAFAMSGMLAAIVSLLLVTQTGVLSYQMGQPLLQIAFVATVIGGMGSLLGSVIGGFAVGVISVFLQIVLPMSMRPFRDAVVFALVILILLFRPQGLVAIRAMKERI